MAHKNQQDYLSRFLAADDDFLGVLVYVLREEMFLIKSAIVHVDVGLRSPNEEMTDEEILENNDHILKVIEHIDAIIGATVEYHRIKRGKQ